MMTNEQLDAFTQAFFANHATPNPRRYSKYTARQQYAIACRYERRRRAYHLAGKQYRPRLGDVVMCDVSPVIKEAAKNLYAEVNQS